MSFALDNGDALIVWNDDGSIEGFPSDAVSDAEDALIAPGEQGATPTGPFFEQGSPEASFLVLRRMWPQAEVGGDVPAFEQQPDELDVTQAIAEAPFEEVLHPRGRAGRWVAKLAGMSREEFNAHNPSYDWPSHERAARFDALPDDAHVWLYHATSWKEDAARFERDGINPESKPSSLARQRYEAGERAEFAPGAGLSGGLYVGFDPRAVEGYGRHIVAVRVRKGDVQVPPEQGGVSPGEALMSHDGAVVHAKIPAEDVQLIGDAARGVPVSEQRIPGHPHDEFRKMAEHAHAQESVFDPAKHPRSRLGRWTESLHRLADITEEDVKAGRVPGMKFDPHVSPGIAAHMRDPENITFGPGGFREGKIDTLLAAHEIGHEVGQHLMASAPERDVSKIPEIQAFRGEGEHLTPGVGYMPVYDNPFGASTRPEEMLADAYASLLTGRLHSFEEPESETAQKQIKLMNRVARAARELGLPDKQIFKLDISGPLDARVYRWVPISEAYEESLHPRDRLGRWRREPGLLHAFKHVAEGAKGSYEIEQSGKVWAAYKNGRPFGVAKTMARAKTMVAAHDAGNERDGRVLLEDAYRGNGHMHEVWGGNPVWMTEEEYGQARQRMLDLRDSIASDSLLGDDLRGVVGAALASASQERAKRAAR